MTFLVVLCGMQDVSSLTRDRTHAAYGGSLDKGKEKGMDLRHTLEVAPKGY